MKKAIGYALICFAVVEAWSPDWWIAAKAELRNKIEQVKEKNGVSEEGR